MLLMDPLIDVPICLPVSIIALLQVQDISQAYDINGVNFKRKSLELMESEKYIICNVSFRRESSRWIKKPLRKMDHLKSCNSKE